jgi:soluble lytic murein transglycosylase
MWGRYKVLFNQQRYQKNMNFSAMYARRSGLGVWLALAVGMAGCAGAEAPARSSSEQASLAAAAAQMVASADLRQSLAPVDTTQPTSQPGAPQRIVLITPPQARQAVVDARAAMQKKQWAALAQLQSLARTDPLLGSYAEYWLLRQKLQDSTQPVPDAEIQQFMQNNSDAYLSDRIKADWIVASARAGNYRLATHLGPVVATNASVDCSRLLSQHMMGERVSAEKALAAFSPNSACWSMLDEFYSSKIVGWKHLEPLLRATLETSKTGDAQRLAAVMFDASEMVSYAALMKDPKKWLAGRKPPKTRADTELVTIALSRLARGNQREVNASYIESQWANAIPKSNMEWVWGQFGLVAALNVDVDAAKWYRRSGLAHMTDYNHAWEVRSELRQPRVNWERVAKAIRKMTARQAAEPVWVYWYARSLEATGNKKAAEQHYVSIADGLDFYGQLASEELGRTPALPPAPAPVTQAELAEARANLGLARAIELFNLGWRPEAVPEWNFTLRGMSDRQLLAAAELARHEHIYDRVVNTSLQTRNEIDFTQRFIAPFEGRVTEKARLINLDPAWVYGLIRQESRFITDARSRVGASGLMQLMPATARWVARKIGMKDFTPSSVNDFDTNTVLGTNYLSMVLNDLNGSQVLATAGYNAGPGRPVQWRAKLAGPVEGAIFAETIPFTETRLYVKNVMSNATYYAMMFSGKPHSLKERLGTIAPAAVSKIDLP